MISESRPNLVMFIPDQLRFDALGCFGNPRANTPHLDALAARGTRFVEAYAEHSVCSPSRVSFLTGWYPHVRGHRSLGDLLQASEPNLLRTLKDSGYHVAHAGLRGDTFARVVTKQSTDRFGFAVQPTMLFQKSQFPPEHKFARVLARTAQRERSRSRFRRGCYPNRRGMARGRNAGTLAALCPSDVSSSTV